MKKLIPALAALAILASGCGGKNTSDEVADSGRLPIADRKAVFADALVAKFPGDFGEADPDVLWRYATIVCRGLDFGLTFTGTTRTFQKGTGYSAYEAGFIVGEAITVQCPTHLEAAAVELTD